MADGSHCSVYLNPTNFTRRYHSELVFRTIPLERKEKRRGQKVVLPASSLSHQPVGGKDATESTFARASAVAEVVDSLFDVENQKPNQGDCEGSRLVLVIVGFLHHFSSKRREEEGPLEQGKKAHTCSFLFSLRAPKRKMRVEFSLLLISLKPPFNECACFPVCE